MQNFWKDCFCLFVCFFAFCSPGCPGTQYITGLKFLILLPLPSKCWDYRRVSSHQTGIIFFKHSGQGPDPVGNLPSQSRVIALLASSLGILHTLSMRNLTILRSPAGYPQRHTELEGLSVHCPRLSSRPGIRSPSSYRVGYRDGRRPT